jgi:hypothetical protein
LYQAFLLATFVSVASAQTVNTTGYSGPITIGSARVQSSVGQRSVPLSILARRQQEVLTAETALNGASAMQTGRIPVEAQGTINTGLAFANLNEGAASLSFVIADASGSVRGSGNFTIPANGQLARFITETPFSAGGTFNGSLAFTSTAPIAVIAIRTVINERFDFLMTQLPVIDANLPVPVGSVADIPHFANGGGWTAEVILINPTNERMSGDVLLVDTSGRVFDTLAFAIEAGGVSRLRPVPPSAGTQLGHARIVPNLSSRTAAGAVILSYQRSSTRVAEITIPIVPATAAFRFYAETDPVFGIQTGVAIANPNATPVTANLELTNSSGVFLGRTSLVLPAFGQTSALLDMLLTNVLTSYEGTLRVSTDVASTLSVVALRRRINERGDPLFSAYAAAIEGDSLPAYVPHFATGGGYSTQFVLFSTSPEPASGTFQFFDPSGVQQSISLFEVSTTASPSVQIISPDVLFPGTSMPLTLTGSNFVPGRIRILISGGGVFLRSLEPVTGTSITGLFAADPNVTLGNRIVSLSSVGGLSNPVTLRVINVETAATPPQATIGQTNVPLTVVAYFESIHRFWLGGIRGVQFSINGVPDPAIVLSNIQIQGNTIEATMDVGTSAIPGPHTIVLVTPSGNIPTIGSLLINAR